MHPRLDGTVSDAPDTVLPASYPESVLLSYKEFQSCSWPDIVGRRNWLFSKSIRGADASAAVYSITETALLNGLKPYFYLTYVLEQLRRMGPFPKAEELDRLLPWSKGLPEELYTKK